LPADNPLVRVTRVSAVFAALVSSVLLAAPGAHAAGVGVPTACADDDTSAGYAHCNSEILVSPTTRAPIEPSTHAGYGADDIQSAYNLAGLAATRGADQTVAVVDAYDHPNAETDVAAYRSYYGLPACTTANGCFRKVNQSGGTTPPLPNAGWALETSLDLDVVSATCPRCHILLVEANTNLFTDLAAAVDRAAILGATQITNSYGGSELGTTSIASHYSHPGIAITASSGDDGFETVPEAPASFPAVTAVGGTRLTRDTSARGWSETAWSGGGSGCSTRFAKPSWQHDSGCTRRTLADVSAVGDPNTGVAVHFNSNWLIVGGTSAASPLIAGYYALIGSDIGSTGASWAYGHPERFFDVTSGTNGTCTLTYVCTAGIAYDGPTGLGTPNGTPGNTPPSASLTVAPNPAAAGTAVTFDAQASSDPDGSIVHYEWDLDGNGSYETDTGTTPTTSHVYADAGAVTVGVRVTDNQGGTAMATRTLTVVNVPTNAALPTISGTAQQGATLTCSTGSWTGSPISFARQWTRDGTDIDGASSSFYAVTAADVSHSLACRVSATNVAGTGQATSDSVTPIAGASSAGSTGNPGTGNPGAGNAGTGTGTPGSATTTTGGGSADAGAGSGSTSAGADGPAAGGSSSAGGASAALALSLQATAATLNRSGRGRIPVHCDGPARSTCQVQFTLQTRAGKGKHPRRVGTGSGQVAAGDEAMLAFVLNRTGRTLLGRAGRLALTVSGTARAGTSQLAFSEPLRLTLRAGRASPAGARQGG
jgi:hypothetical protein